ncbi:hypothetical protein BFU36_00765 [Sulfolobus sp. A20]|uniref:universal stress protein n=1 Tax=Saccharolobus sp. A20 TaxID=1891280 RepID=UPI00086390F2|nr:universal stress protein [Sulfolobus sp. A20]TRM76084.1 universal stress protein [Sulfolobus sp. A20-N-F8]TRM77144.1 universal stress protein [Sulfolobus sp. B5]TRM88559.1 universal stress protein [Sulfolobus sp. C3]TRM89126.1 universal stress protein [Sulfolobus sp. E3]TRM94807.1 universal stress protein [Sulfolobus sp. A20-N-G8]TRM96738.1 universal stress protein [Sulfolobus sp. F1]TRN03156.1 universal stress protein [Sulfolobus sp. E1]
MISKILVAYDGSSSAEKALDFAIDLAKSVNASVVILHVVNTCIESWGVVSNDTIERMKKKAYECINNAVEKVKKNGISVEGQVIEGEPSSTIVDFAEKVNASLIVVGSRGLSRLKRTLIGSVSLAVLEHSKIPVLVVK